MLSLFSVTRCSMFDVFTVSTIIIFSLFLLKSQILNTVKAYNSGPATIWYFIVSIFSVVLVLLLFMDTTVWFHSSNSLMINGVNGGISAVELFMFSNGSANCIYSFFTACSFTMIIFFVLLLIRVDGVSLIICLNLIFLILLSIIFIFNKSLVVMFIVFESLLLVSINVLKLTSKSERIGEAISEMFVWTLFGSFFLLIGIFLLINESGVISDSGLESFFFSLKSNSSNSLISFFLFLGFGVKIPTWPFISWLLKAHVEASVEFSILLSGFIVKLGVLGLWRILDTFAPEWFYLIILAASTLAIIDASLRLFGQTDLKKIVALTTVIEMNWLNLSYSLGDINLVFLANYLIVIHSFTTASEFLLVEYISKRYNTRNFLQISGLWYNTPNLWFISFLVVFVTIGFPGSSIFFAKFLFLSTILSYSIVLFFFFLFIFFLILPLFFIRLWIPVWFGFSKNTNKRNTLITDLTGKEFMLITITIFAGLIFGVAPSWLFFIF